MTRKHGEQRVSNEDAPMAADGAVLRQSPEQRHAGELDRLAAGDSDPRPPGWQLSAKAVRRFIVGDEALAITRKFYGDDIEELTRAPPEIQDTLISILSEKMIAIPELGDASSAATVRARPGFNVIGTANLRDRGVHEMSSALKRRFNFETVHPIRDAHMERELILSQLQERVPDAAQRAALGPDVLDVIVATFQELRLGRTPDGVQVARPETIMSTAEAVNVAHASLIEAAYLGPAAVSGAHVANQLQGVVLKDNPEDGKRLRAYVEHVAKPRAETHAEWRAFYEAARRMRLA